MSLTGKVQEFMRLCTDVGSLLLITQSLLYLASTNGEFMHQTDVSPVLTYIKVLCKEASTAFTHVNTP